MSISTAPAAIQAFYDALNTPASKDVAGLLTQALHEDWRSYSDESTWKGREGLIGQVKGFGQLIPDLSWDVREVIVAGDRVIVRSVASGTPAAPFMGAPQGGRFAITTIDVHTLRGDKLSVAWHVEDWMSAVRQLTAAAAS